MSNVRELLEFPAATLQQVYERSSPGALDFIVAQAVCASKNGWELKVIWMWAMRWIWETRTCAEHGQGVKELRVRSAETYVVKRVVAKARCIRSTAPEQASGRILGAPHQMPIRPTLFVFSAFPSTTAALSHSLLNDRLAKRRGRREVRGCEKGLGGK